MKSYFCQDEYGQIAPVYSISAGLDYPGIGPEHAHLYDTGRAEYVPVTDEEAVEAFEYLSRTEGIIPAIESAHAVAYAKKIVPQMRKDQIVVITISGRGDKDCAAIIILMFALGAGIGGNLSIRYGIRMIWVSCGFLMISFLLMFIEKYKHFHEEHEIK